MKGYLAAMALTGLIVSPAVADAPKVAAKAGAKPGATHVHRVFDVMRKGSKIGTNTFDITRAGDATTVKLVSHVLVKIAFITAYRFDQTATESWKGSQLVSFKSTTDDNGTNHEISAGQSGGKVTLTVDGAASPVPKAIAPASIWGPEVSKHPQLFDPTNGKRMSVQAQDLGDETVEMNGVPKQLRHVKLSGEFDRDLWFDEQGLVKMAMSGSDGSEITSELRTSTAAR